MNDIWINVAIIVTCYAVGFVIRRWVDQRRQRRSAAQDTGDFTALGVYVEADCRTCGQFNRVPSHRLRDRPRCGRCKARLMPGKRVVLCRVRPMEALLQTELDKVWKDEDRLWQSLADHVALENKARAEARDPSLRVVN